MAACRALCELVLSPCSRVSNVSFALSAEDWTAVGQLTLLTRLELLVEVPSSVRLTGLAACTGLCELVLSSVSDVSFELGAEDGAVVGQLTLLTRLHLAVEVGEDDVGVYAGLTRLQDIRADWWPHAMVVDALPQLPDVTAIHGGWVKEGQYSYDIDSEEEEDPVLFPNVEQVLDVAGSPPFSIQTCALCRTRTPFAMTRRRSWWSAARGCVSCGQCLALGMMDATFMMRRGRVGKLCRGSRS